MKEKTIGVGSLKSIDSEKNAGKQMPFDKTRRRALMGAATGAGIAAWHKPIVSSIMLPAHAQTSGDPTPFFGANVTTNPLTSSNSLLDLLIPQAIAGIAPQPVEYTISVVPIGEDEENFTIRLFEDLGETQGFSLAQVVYSGEVSVSNGGSLSPSDNPCNLEGLVDIEVSISSVDADAVGLDLTNRAQSVTVPAGEGTLPVPMCTDGPDALNFKVENYSQDSNQASNSSLLNVLVSDAHAGDFRESSATYTILAQETTAGSGSFEISLFERIENPRSQLYSVVESTFTGTIDGPGTGTLNLQTAGCDEAPTNSINTEIVSVSEAELVMSLDSREVFSIPLTPGTVTIPAPMCEELPKADSYFQEGVRDDQGGNDEGNRPPPPPSAFGISAVRIGDTNEYTVEVLNPRGDILRTRALNIDGTLLELLPADANSPCTARENLSARIGFLNETEMELAITTGSNTGNAIVTVFLPAASGSLAAICQPL